MFILWWPQIISVSVKSVFLNMTVTSLHSNGLDIYQILIQWSTFGMWWSWRWTKISEECFKHLVDSNAMKTDLKEKWGQVQVNVTKKGDGLNVKLSTIYSSTAR